MTDRKLGRKEIPFPLRFAVVNVLDHGSTILSLQVGPKARDRLASKYLRW